MIFSDTDSCLDGRTTDGANETEYAHRFTSRPKTQRYPVTPSRRDPSSDSNISMQTALHVKPSTPAPAFLHGFDGHRSDSYLDHPNDRPRAQHTCSSRRSSRSHYELSDRSYRSGPDAESGRSSS